MYYKIKKIQIKIIQIIQEIDGLHISQEFQTAKNSKALRI